MNWLGDIVQEGINKNDTVLDVGCGIMQHTTSLTGEEGNLVCRTIVGVELYEPYLARVKDAFPTVRWDVKDLSIFSDKSYDAVIMIDIVEHLEDPLKLIDEARRVARKYVFIFTPLIFSPNDGGIDSVWDIPGINELQRHRSLVTKEQLEERGFTVEIRDSSIYAKWKL